MTGSRTDRRGGVVEIFGPWVLNKGDDLMLRAVVDRLGARFPLAVSSLLGLAERPHPSLREIRWRPAPTDWARAVRSLSVTGLSALLRRRLLLALPRRHVESRGFVSGEEVGLLLDCSGFCYGDQWSARRPRVRAEYFARLKRQGARLVLLPQALGPFETPDVLAACTEMFCLFDRIYARDERSEAFVCEGVGDPARVRRVPDITHLLHGPPVPREEWEGRACIVPNMRMLDKTAEATSRRYIDFLLYCARFFHDHGLEPVLLLHEQNDRSLAEDLRARLSFPVSIVDEDALTTKSILGACHTVLSSRYHALVGALSQGTPTLGTSWSHKYNGLFEEYGCTQNLLSPATDDETLASVLEDVLDPTQRACLQAGLHETAARHADSVRAMWQDVEALLAHP